MDVRLAAVAGVMALGAAGCARREDPAALRVAVMEADRAFAAATARRGVDGWVEAFEADARQFHARGVSTDTAQIRSRMAPAFADTTRQLRWHPVSAVVAASGDMAYTIGRWESRLRGPDGQWGPTGSGNYVTVWRRQADGGWKVAVDIGNQDVLPADSTNR